MKTTLKLKNGDVVYMKYMTTKYDELEMIPFYYVNYDIPLYLENGRYELFDGGYFTIEDTKIIELHE